MRSNRRRMTVWACLASATAIAGASVSAQADPPPVDPEETFAASEMLAVRSAVAAPVNTIIDDDVLEAFAAAGVWAGSSASVDGTSARSAREVLVHATPLGRGG